LQKFPEAICARVAELVLGSTPAGTPGVVDQPRRDRRLPAGSLNCYTQVLPSVLMAWPADRLGRPLTQLRLLRAAASHLQATTLARNI
jgi:hypothetical protein